MQPPPTASAYHIASTREVFAVDVLNGTAELQGYPFQHLCLIGFGKLRMSTTTEIMVALDVLAPLGWELVSVIKPHEHTAALAAFLRRRE